MGRIQPKRQSKHPNFKSHPKQGIQNPTIPQTESVITQSFKNSSSSVANTLYNIKSTSTAHQQVSNKERPVNIGELKIGENVAVNNSNGNKIGILRYLGQVEFAKGDWAGVELEEKLGKNDGGVGNKRYFSL